METAAVQPPQPIPADAKGGRWVSPEHYAEIVEQDKDLIKRMTWTRCPRKMCPKRFDERDLKRFSKKRVSIFYMPPNIAGIDRPRIVEREG